MSIEVIKVTMAVTVPVILLACILAGKKDAKFKICAILYLITLLIMFFSIHNMTENAIEGMILQGTLPAKYSSDGGWSFNYDTVEMMLMGTMLFALIYFPFFALYFSRDHTKFVRRISLGGITVIFLAYIAWVVAQVVIFKELAFIILIFGLLFTAITGSYLYNVYKDGGYDS